MPHQCVKCGKFHDDGAQEIIAGCPCGSKLFFYVKPGKVEEARRTVEKLHLSKDDKDQIERDVYDILGSDHAPEESVVLDLESIKILGPGKYELDLVNLFKKKQPIIYKLEDGKYMIDLPESFKKLRSEPKEKKRRK